MLVSIAFLYITLETTAQDASYEEKVEWVGSYYLYALKVPPLPAPVEIPPIKLGTLGARFVPPTGLCSCVGYARTQAPKDLPFPTTARDIIPNSKEPTIGAWVLFKPGGKYSYFGHTGVVVEISNTEIRIKEANYIPCKKSERIIPLDDPSILGYYN